MQCVPGAPALQLGLLPLPQEQNLGRIGGYLELSGLTFLIPPPGPGAAGFPAEAGPLPTFLPEPSRWLGQWIQQLWG